MIESSPIMSNEHVVIRAVTGHENPAVTHVVRGKTAWGRARVRRDAPGCARVYIQCPTRADLLKALTGWYTPGQPPADKR